MPTPVPTIRLATAAAAAWLCVPLAAQAQPEFTTADAEDLRCRIVKAEEVHDTLWRLQVEVRNGTGQHAEPLRFVVKSGKRVRRGDQTITEDSFERCLMPLVGRFGNGIPPRGKGLFWINTAVAPKLRPKVSVTAATFHEGFDAPKSGPEVTAPTETRATNDFLGKDFQVASFQITNPLPWTADVWLLAEYERPVQSEELLAYRVRAGATREIKLGMRAPRSGFDQSGTAYGVNVRLGGLRVIDWVAVGTIDHGPATERFHDILGSWAVWPSSLRGVTATFTTKEQGIDFQSGDPLRLQLKGRIEIGLDRRVTVVLDDKSQRRMKQVHGKGMSLALNSDSRLQKDATRFLRRRPLDQVAEQCEVLQVTPDSVQLIGPRMDVDYGSSTPTVADGTSPHAKRFVLGDGRILRDGYGTETSNDWTWTTDELGKEWVVTERRYDVPHFAVIKVERYEYERVGGLPVVSAFEYLEIRDGETVNTQRIEFDGWQFEFSEAPVAAVDAGAPPAGPAPAGPGADRLAEAWDQLPQWPSDGPAWHGKIHVQAARTDASWQGHHQFTAGVRASGLGTRGVSLEFDLGGSLPSETEVALASVVKDRLGMWYGGDPQTRGAFATYFAGATISKRSTKGWHRIENHELARVRIVDSRVREIEYRGGRHLRLHYTEFAGTQWITRIERGVGTGAEVEIELGRLGDHVVPTRFAFRNIFGKDWGPETFQLRELELSDS